MSNNNFSAFNPRNLVPKLGCPNRFDDRGGNRFYYYKENDLVKTAVGVTTMLSSVMKESPFLLDWKLKWGKDGDAMLNATADYGTSLHACMEYILINEEYPPLELIEESRRCIQNLRRFDKKVTLNMIDKDLISFIKFKNDYNIEPILIEGRLVLKAVTGDAYALALDLLCFIDKAVKVPVTYKELVPKNIKTEVPDGVYSKGAKKGQPRFKTVTESKMVEVDVSKIESVITRVPALVDFKSNYSSKESKSFYDNHRLQLQAARKAVEQNFGRKVDVLINFSPLGWSSVVGKYVVKEWEVTAQDDLELELYERLASIKRVYTPSGSIESFKQWAPGMKAEDMYSKLSYSEYVLALDQYEQQIMEVPNEHI